MGKSPASRSGLKRKLAEQQQTQAGENRSFDLSQQPMSGGLGGAAWHFQNSANAFGVMGGTTAPGVAGMPTLLSLADAPLAQSSWTGAGAPIGRGWRNGLARNNQNWQPC